MAPGRDKVIPLDPPGAIGLTDPEPVLFVRFDEADTDTRPQDAFSVLNDFVVDIDGFTAHMPEVVDGVLGRARAFNGINTGIGSRDRVSGSTLLTRDVSIQVVLSWDAAVQQSAFGNPGTIVSRGIHISPAEYMPYCLQIEVIDLPSFTGRLRWLWHDLSGDDKLQDGFDVVMPPGQFTMLTATRRWVSPTEVVLRYYVGDLLLGEVTSSDGEIGGGTTGATLIGYRRADSVTNKYAGVIDELLIVGRELTLEEIEATWLRITRYQPLGVQLFRETHDQGFPQSLNPASRVQRENQMIGNGLGYAAAAAENMRANALPGRSYGSTLDDWETAVRVTPAPVSSIDDRRARVVARMRQRRGVSIGGLEDSLVGLLGGGTVEDLEFLAFTNDISDDFTTLDPLRWDITPAGSFTAVSGSAHVAPGAGTFLMDGATRDWRHCEQAIGGDGLGAHHLAKLVFTTPQSTAEAGIYFGNPATGDYLLLGLREITAVFAVRMESFIGGVSQGETPLDFLGGNPAAIWLHLRQVDGSPGTWKASWSVTSATSGFTTSGNITHPTVQNVSGLYLRSTGAIGAAVADFGGSLTRAPLGTRPFNAYVLLDDALGFSPDVDGATSVIQAIKHAHTHGCFITNRSVLCDTPFGCDLGPMGGI